MDFFLRDLMEVINFRDACQGSIKHLAYVDQHLFNKHLLVLDEEITCLSGLEYTKVN